MTATDRKLSERPSAEAAACLAWLATVNASDVEDIKQAMYDAHNQITAAKLRIKALKTLLRAAECGPRKKPTVIQSPLADALNVRIHDLLTERGSMPLPAIAATIGVSEITIRAATGSCDWFLAKNGEIHIAKA